MAKARLMPYRTLTATDVDWGGWWLERGGVREPLPDLLPSWDYASSDRVGITIDVNPSRVLEACGLDDISLIEVVAVVDCPSMLRRFVHRRCLSESQTQAELAVDLPPGETAQKLELSAVILLGKDLPPRGRTATRRGSRLGVGPTRKVLLEGDASRFPTEAVLFSELRLENAPWTINAVFDGMDDSFMGSVRLLVNLEHELGREVLSDTAPPSLQARLKFEILRSLVALSSTQEIAATDDFSPDSIGEVVQSMCQLFLRRSLHEAIQMYVRSPAKFDRLLHAGVGT